MFKKFRRSKRPYNDTWLGLAKCVFNHKWPHEQEVIKGEAAAICSFPDLGDYHYLDYFIDCSESLYLNNLRVEGLQKWREKHSIDICNLKNFEVICFLVLAKKLQESLKSFTDGVQIEAGFANDIMSSIK